MAQAAPRTTWWITVKIKVFSSEPIERTYTFSEESELIGFMRRIAGRPFVTVTDRGVEHMHREADAMLDFKEIYDRMMKATGQVKDYPVVEYERLDPLDYRIRAAKAREARAAERSAHPPKRKEAIRVWRA